MVNSVDPVNLAQLVPFFSSLFSLLPAWVAPETKNQRAAKLNLANGSDPTPVASTIVDADALLSGFTGKLPYNVKTPSPTGHRRGSVTDLWPLLLEHVRLEGLNKLLWEKRTVWPERTAAPMAPKSIRNRLIPR